MSDEDPSVVLPGLEWRGEGERYAVEGWDVLKLGHRLWAGVGPGGKAGVRQKTLAGVAQAIRDWKEKQGGR